MLATYIRLPKLPNTGLRHFFLKEVLSSRPPAGSAKDWEFYYVPSVGTWYICEYVDYVMEREGGKEGGKGRGGGEEREGGNTRYMNN